MSNSQLTRRSACQLLGGAPFMFSSARAASDPSGADLLNRIRENYAALQYYTDEGESVSETGSSGRIDFTERAVFETRFSRPKSFYFDFREDAASGADRYVVWCGGETFSSWWKASDTLTAYPPGQGIAAFSNGSYPTRGAVALVAPWLFSGSGLVGPLSTMSAPTLEANEEIDGRACHVLAEALALNHWGGETRLTRIWTDIETDLITRVVEETPTGLPIGAIQRIETLLRAREEAAPSQGFDFAPP